MPEIKERPAIREYPNATIHWHQSYPRSVTNVTVLTDGTVARFRQNFSETILHVATFTVRIVDGEGNEVG